MFSSSFPPLSMQKQIVRMFVLFKFFWSALVLLEEARPKGLGQELFVV